MHRDDTEENAALLAAVLRTAIDAIITIDDRGIIQHANHAVATLFGYSVAEVIGQNVSLLMPEPERSEHDRYLSKYRETKKTAIIGVGREVLGQRKDGSLIPLDLAVSEIFVGGRVLFTGILRDMTLRNRAAADLQMAEQRMIQSERLAAIGQMMTGLAHESRNALQRSRACLDMLEMDLARNSEQKDLVQRTRTALLELQTLYEEVRSYAAPVVLERSSEFLHQVCSEVWEHLTEERGPMAVDLHLRCHDSPPCRIDKYRMSQVFRNIFENAIAVSPSGSTIQVDCRVCALANRRAIQVRILDQGPGIDPIQREKIFEPFFTTKSKGTGLGMAISQRIIEAHGGRIYLGDPFKGAEIVIDLPVDGD